MILAYSPVLLILPILLLVGFFTVVMGGFVIVFTVVMGGFLIILSSLYSMLVQIIGLVAHAARARRRASRMERPTRSRVVSGPITYPSPPSQVAGRGGTAMTAVPRPDKVFARRPSPSRVGTDGLGGSAIVDARRPQRDSGPVA
jgi:membrane protein implicated in regulation of membrane protease activity